MTLEILILLCIQYFIIRYFIIAQFSYIERSKTFLTYIIKNNLCPVRGSPESLSENALLRMKVMLCSFFVHPFQVFLYWQTNKGCPHIVNFPWLFLFVQTYLINYGKLSFCRGCSGLVIQDQREPHILGSCASKSNNGH